MAPSLASSERRSQRDALRRRTESVVARLKELGPSIGGQAGDLLGDLEGLLESLEQQSRAEIEAERKLACEHAARVHAEAVRKRDAFLAEAGEILGSSLDYAVTLSSLARLAVPRIADSCVVYVMSEDGAVSRLGCAHADPQKDRVLREIVRDRPFDKSSITGPVARAIRMGAPELIPDIPIVHRASPIAPRSLIIVPLKVGERTLGALSLGWDSAGGYAPDDHCIARKLADRAALAIENARLHETAKRASEAKSAFVAAMSHEFRTPLTAILAYAELLVAGVPEPVTGAALRHAERIVFATRHLAQLIEQVLKIARIEAGRETVQLEKFELSSLVRDTAELVEPLARQHDLELTVELPPDPVIVFSDANKIRQILFNLIGNAVKFTSSGEVRVRLVPSETKTTIEVRDTGSGISKEDLEKIWEPFWRSGEEGRNAQPGTGLGLGIARTMVRMLGGEIHASSEPGVGSLFAVELPLRQDR